MRVLVEFNKELDQDQLEDEDMEALRNIELTYDEWLRQVRSEANRETLIKTIHALCRRCEIELTDERLSQLEQWNTEELQTFLVELGATHEWPTPR